MQVSKLLGFGFLALLCGLLLVFAPISAGEHPWDGQQAGTGSDSTSAVNDQKPGDTVPSDNDDIIDELFTGTHFYQWVIVIENTIAASGKDTQLPASGSVN